MKLIVPSYYKNFRCIGGECTDNCCIGWEIDIDKTALTRYEKTKGPLGERLKKNISYEGTPHFILCGERCPFLNGKNLCDIIIERGEEYLCDICREHPRYYTALGDMVFGGVGMCCEAAAELVLTNDAPAGFITLEAEGDIEECDEELLNAVLNLREEIFALFGETKTIVYTLNEALALASKAQAEIDEKPEKPCKLKKKEAEEKLLHLLEKMEFMSDELPKLMSVSCRKDLISQNDTVNKYLHNVLAYFLHRYLLKAAEDGYIIGKIAIAIASVLVLARLFSAEENLTLGRAVYLSKLYSKEVEYNEDNIAVIEENAENLFAN